MLMDNFIKYKTNKNEVCCDDDLRYSRLNEHFAMIDE